MKKKKKRIHLNLALYCMLIPGFVYLLFNNYIPMTFTVIAFKNLIFRKVYGEVILLVWIISSLFFLQEIPGLYCVIQWAII